MKVVGVVAAVVGALFVAAAGLIWMLARRVVGTKPRRKTLTVRGLGDSIEMPRNDLTVVAGNYGLWFGERFEHHALIGSVVSAGGDRITRRVLKTTAPIGPESFKAQWTGHTMSGPAEIDPDWEDVTVPLRDGGSAPAWLFRSATTVETPWVIHVQGIRTSRLVTLRSVEVVQAVGLTSLVITYSGSGGGPATSASSLGQTEWSDLADAITYARSRGATAVYVVAWSMGAGLALELLRREPEVIDRLALLAPATNWRLIIRHGVKRAGLPTFLGRLLLWALESPLVSRIAGLDRPLELDRLDWSHADEWRMSTLVVHSDGDQEIPLELTRVFAAAHRDTTLVQTASAPHGWEPNVDPDLFWSALKAWLR